MHRIDDACAGYALDLVARAAYVMTAVIPHFDPIVRANGIGRRHGIPSPPPFGFV
jgi:hypothetical protein